MIDPVARGERARQIMEDELFIETVEALRKSLMDRVEAASTNEATIDAVNAYRALNAFLSEFKSVITTGEIAAKRAAK